MPFFNRTPLLRQDLFKTLLALALLLPLAGRGDPAADVRTAASALATTSYTWETTAPQRVNGDPAAFQPNPNAPLAMQGKVAPNAYMEITLLPARDTVPVPVTAVFHAGDVVGLTPLGWQRRTEMRTSPGPDRTIDFQGKPVRLSQALKVALRVTALRPLTEELFDLIDDCKSFRSESGLVIAELREAPIEKLWGDPQAKRAPEIQGTVIFKLSDAGISEYHFVLAIGFPNSRTKQTAWSIKQWSTRIKAIGSTTVDPPAAAVKRLDEE